MCGFCGFYLNSQSNIEKSKKTLFDMNSALSHRGPDAEGHEFDVNEKTFLAHKRLSILDLNSRSNQPFINKNDLISLVYNGEIYNYIELKEALKNEYNFTTSGDTEVIIAAYLAWGVNMLDRIKGMFSFCIVDKKKKIYFCARDHFGQKPFHYYYDNKEFIFSSELRSLMKHPSITKKLNINNTLNYLHYDSFVGSQSPIKNCFKLNPSEYLIFDYKNNNLKVNKYWNLSYKEEYTDKKKFQKNFLDIFQNSVHEHLRSDVPVGIYLSGGVDSTSIACMAKKVLGYENLTAFNLKFGQKSFDEDLMALNTAKKLNIKLVTHELSINEQKSKCLSLIDDLDEPLADPGYLANGMISEVVKKSGFKVVLAGDGGDELFGGYEPFLKLNIFNFVKNSSLLKKIINTINTYSKDSFGYMGFTYKLKTFAKGFLHDDEYYNSRWLCAFLPEEINKLVDWSNISNFKFQEDSIYGYVSHLINSDNKPKDDYEKLLRQYQKHYLSNLICSHTDKANMNFSIEARAPFLDKDLFEYTNNAKNNLKNKNGVSKLILRNFLSKNNLAEVGKYRKKGFTVPMAFWINGSLKEEIMDTLSEKEINSFGLIKYNQVKDILNSHFSGKENNYKKIYNLFVLFKWLKKNNVTY